MEERLTSLEMKCAYLEDFLNSLQEVVVKQGNQISLLEAEKKAMRKKISELSDMVEGDIPQNRPPHY